MAVMACCSTSIPKQLPPTWWHSVGKSTPEEHSNGNAQAAGSIVSQLLDGIFEGI